MKPYDRFDKGKTAGRAEMKKEIENKILEWGRELKYGSEVKPFKDWARTQEFYEAILLLLGRIRKIEECK